MMAAREGRTESVELLLKHGANAALKRNDRESAITLARKAGHKGVVALLRVAARKTRDTFGPDGFLLTGARTNSRDMVMRAIEQGADPDAQDSKGNTALILALESDLDPKTSPIIRMAIVQALLDMQADPNVANDDGWTPLMKTIDGNRIQVAEVLLRHGASPNAANKGGITALMLAALNNRSEMARLLVGRGSDMNLRDKQGQTALDHARNPWKHLETIKVLEELRRK